MAEYDVIIKGGVVVDGTRLPRYQADIGVKNGLVAKIGNLKAHQAKKTIDAGGHYVVPGSSISTPITMRNCSGIRTARYPSWHGVTSVVIGNCGFGFAPVKPEMRERAMLTMTRTEAIPYHIDEGGDAVGLGDVSRVSRQRRARAAKASTCCRSCRSRR